MAICAGFPQVKEDSMPSRSYGYRWYPMELPLQKLESRGVLKALIGL